MSNLRAIKPEEKAIINAMIQHAGLDERQAPISELVSEYGDPFMGSINLNNDRPDEYAGDLAKCEYVDEDGEKVVLILTFDKDAKLLDLDFWKSNFSPLVNYPNPETVVFS
ncbi:MAG: hypothetical protein OCD76_02705 [Reichenbachiella sp.]